MCILCAVQGGSRRAIGMLQCVAIPLVLVWSLSQLLPPGLRLEVSSPRLACAAVLLGTIFWYEILLPQVVAFKARRLARARELQLSMAVEAQKLRKTATRRCRNCLAAYQNQNPGGGKFMCGSCGHFSKRPVLDLPGGSESGGSGFFGDFAWNKSWFYIPPSVGNSEGTLSLSSSTDLQESKGEKARRKAEEKKLARLEKELREEEEKQQREEVARLVEERRKLREDKVEPDKDEAKREKKKPGRKREKEKERESLAAESLDSPKKQSSCKTLVKREKGDSLSSSKSSEVCTQSPRKSSQASVFSTYKPRSSSGRVDKSETSNLVISPPVLVEPPAADTPKKSWHRLFTEEDDLMQDLSSGSHVKDDLFSSSCHSNKPGPIESPTSRSCSLLQPNDADNAIEPGIWQMWGTSPFSNGLGLVGESAGWFSSSDRIQGPDKNHTPSHAEILCTDHDSFCGMDDQFIGDHHFHDDEKIHPAHLGFCGSAEEKVERCMRPYMYPPRMMMDRSHAHYYYWGWPIPRRRNVGIPMVFVPPRRQRYFLPTQIYTQPAFFPRGSHEQGDICGR